MAVAERSAGTAELAVQFVGVDGAERYAPVVECGSVPFEILAPVAAFVSYRGQRSWPGWWWSATVGRHVGYRSWLARDHAMELDYELDVVAFSARPFWLYFRDGLKDRRSSPPCTWLGGRPRTPACSRRWRPRTSSCPTWCCWPTARPAAAPHARAALQTAQRLRLPWLADIARVQTALCVAAGGERAGAQELIDAVPDPTPGNRALAAMARGVAALVEHDLERALAELDPAVGLVLDDRATPLLAPVGMWMLLHTLLDRQPEQARSRLSAHPGGLSTPNRAALAYADAVRAGRSGAPGDAVVYLAAGGGMLTRRPGWVVRTAARAAGADGRLGNCSSAGSDPASWYRREPRTCICLIWGSRAPAAHSTR